MLVDYRYSPYISKKSFKIESYSNLLIDDNYINAKDIHRIEMPINLNIVYAEYINQS